MLRLTQAAQFQPQPFTVLGWEVEDVKKTLHELTARGVVFEKYPFSDADGIWTIGNDKVAWFKDTEGNVLSIASHG